MVEQLFHTHSIIRVFSEALIEEVPGLLAHKHIGGDADLILDDLDQFFLLVDLKGVLPDQHLVHHDAQRPDVDFLVIVPPFEDLGAHVQGSAAEGVAQSVVVVHRPPEITQFDDILTVWGNVRHGALCSMA